MKRAIVLGALLLAGVTGVGLHLRRTRSLPYQLERRRAEVTEQLRRGDREAAATALAGVLQLAPEDDEAREQLAALHEALGQTAQAEALWRQWLQRDPTRTRVAVSLGRLLLASERPAEAVVLLAPRQEALASQGDPVLRNEALVTLGQALVRVGQVERGIATLRLAVQGRDARALREARPGDAQADDLLALGRALMAAGRWRDAEQPLRLARELVPEGLSAHLALADVLDRLGRTAEAAQLLLDFARAHPDRRLELGPALGELLVRAEQLEAAERLAQELADQDGERGQGAAAHVRGLVALAEGRLGAARQRFQELAGALPRSAQARLLLARVETLAGDALAARTHLEEALRLEPGLAAAELGLLELDERLGEVGKVRERALRLLSSAPARPQAVRALLALYAEDRDPRPAQLRLQELRGASPDDLSLRLFAALFDLLGDEPERGASELAELAAHPGVDLVRALGVLSPARDGGSADSQGAIELLAWIAAREPRLAPARVVLAATYERVGRADLALSELEAALEVDSSLHPARRARARLLARQGQLALASADLEQLRATFPADTGLLAELAELDLRRGEPAEALPLLQRATELAPTSAALQALLGRTRALSGDPQGALQSFAAARRLDPRLPAAHLDAALHLLQGDAQAASQAWRRARAETADPMLGHPLACALALQGQAGAALLELGDVPAGPAGGLLRALLLQLAGDASGGAALATQLGTPPEAANDLGAVDLGRARGALEACALSAVGWDEEVRARAARALEEQPPSAFLTHLLAALPAADDDPDLQLRLRRRLAELVQASPEPGLALADAQQRAGEPAQELATLEELAVRFPEHAGVALRLATALGPRGEKDRASALFSRAAAGPDPSPAALDSLALLLADDPIRRPLAIELARRATRLASQDGQVHGTLGWLLYLDGQWEDAERVLTLAVALDPAVPATRWRLAQVLEARGARARALNHLRLALRAGRPFPERAEAQARLERLAQELHPPAAPPVALTPGASLELATGEQGLARVRIPPATGERLVGLRLQAPSACAASALLAAPGGEVHKRVDVGAGETLFLPRLALDPAGDEVLVRVDARHSGVSVHVTLTEPGSGGETEPDDDPARAAALGVGGSLRGRLDGPADRDHVRLDPGAGSAAGLTIGAGARGPLQVELLRGRRGEGRSIRSFRVEAGSELRLDPIASGGEALLLRVGAAAALAAGVAESDAWDWSVTLSAAEPASGPDREPNDRPEDAARVALGELAGQLGPGDRADWIRLGAEPGTHLTLALSGTGPLRLEVWEQQPVGLLPQRALTIPAAGAVFPRWRTPPTGELLLCLVRADGASAGVIAWALSARATTPGAEARETEPNDLSRAADALPAGTRLRGDLYPGERDWLRAPRPSSGVLGLRVSAAEEGRLDGVGVGIYAATAAGPTLVARFVARGRELWVPALRLVPELGGEVLVLLSGPPGRPAGTWVVELAAAAAGPGRELEPDDDPARACVLPAGGALEGHLSGSADRDLIAIEAAPAVVVRATGALPLAVTRVGAAGEPRQVAPGEACRLELERGRNTLALSLPEDAAPAAEGGASWRVEAER